MYIFMYIYVDLGLRCQTVAYFQTTHKMTITYYSIRISVLLYVDKQFNWPIMKCSAQDTAIHTTVGQPKKSNNQCDVSSV